jgi:hypothetical protein
MDTARLPARLHELYPLDLVPIEGVPQGGEEDYIVLNEVADRIIRVLESVRGYFYSVIFTKGVSKDYTRKIFPAQVTVAVNTLPENNSRCCPFWTCPSGTDFHSYSDLLSHLDDAHPDTFVHAIKLSEPYIFLMLIMPLITEQGRKEKAEALWRPSFLTHFVVEKAPKYAAIFRVCPEVGLEVCDAEFRMASFYNRMITNRVAQSLMTQEQATERLLVNCRRLADMPRKLPVVLKGASEFEQACLLLDGE